MKISADERILTVTFVPHEPTKDFDMKTNFQILYKDIPTLIHQLSRCYANRHLNNELWKQDE